MKKIIVPFLISNKRFFDKRGFFQELYLKKKFNASANFTAIAFSKKNVIRGMHFQLKNKQTKIITVLSGKILDVTVNLKKNSKNFGKKYYFLMKEGQSIYIPNFYGLPQSGLNVTPAAVYGSEVPFKLYLALLCLGRKGIVI